VEAAVDNDVLFKGACYGLLFSLVEIIPCQPTDVGVLGAAPFVVRNLFWHARIAGDPEAAIRSWEEFYNQAEVLEPSIQEVKLAAELEFTAQVSNLSLDSGESQLCAIAIERGSKLITGDKRAITCLAEILAQHRRAPAGKVLCLEQLFLKLLIRLDPLEIRRAVCKEIGIDRALSACFSCYRGNGEDEGGDPNSWSEGLASYISELRKVAGTILAL
jgi:hypothetical protein